MSESHLAQKIWNAIQNSYFDENWEFLNENI